MYAELGVRMLLNRHAVIGANGAELVLVGVTDGVARILLDHRPGNADRNALAGVDLQLSGHTHGGQIAGMTELVSAFNNGYLHGWYRPGGMPLYVSAGAGLWNGFPVRLGVSAEIARITLRSGPAA